MRRITEVSFSHDWPDERASPPRPSTLSQRTTSERGRVALTIAMRDMRHWRPDGAAQLPPATTTECLRGPIAAGQPRTWTFPRWTVRMVVFVGGSTQVVGSASPGLAGIVLTWSGGAFLP